MCRRKIPKNRKAAPAVEFDGVTFTYPTGGAPALSDISFTLEHGKTLGIIGGTGSGKSTLIGLIPRFYDVQEGSVKVDGCDVRQYPLETLRRKIGLVPQKALLFKGTIRENLLWGDEGATDDEIRDALRAAQAQEVVDGKPEGLRLRGRDRRTELLRRAAAAAHDRARTGEKAGSPDSGRQRVGFGLCDGRGASARAQRASVEAGSCHYLAENSIYSLCGRDSRTG